MTFRSQLPPETVKASLPLIANFLKSDSVVVHTYAAAAVEKFLIMKVGGVDVLLENSPVGESQSNGEA